MSDVIQRFLDAGLRYDEATCFWLTEDGQRFLSKKEWHTMTPLEQQVFLDHFLPPRCDVNDGTTTRSRRR